MPRSPATFRLGRCGWCRRSIKKNYTGGMWVHRLDGRTCPGSGHTEGDGEILRKRREDQASGCAAWEHPA
jgi:hypothetical protein